jgi:hypothetical protein
MKNTAKYLSYKKAWERINFALDSNFYLEAITIEESIISDRLLSYLLGISPTLNLSTKSSMGELIKQWRKMAGSKLIGTEGSDLGKLADEWRKKRNSAVHGIVKSSPGTSTIDPSDFFELARQTAIEGYQLTRKIQNWHKEMLDAHIEKHKKP